jgi:hypothetical protein
VQIYDPNDDRYEVPVPLNHVITSGLGIDNAQYSIEITDATEGEAFRFRVFRQNTGKTM